MSQKKEKQQHTAVSYLTSKGYLNAVKPPPETCPPLSPHLSGGSCLWRAGGAGGEVHREQRSGGEPGGQRGAPLRPLGPTRGSAGAQREAVQRRRAAGGTR